MPKRRWRESVKSFFGNHIDPEKDEELKGTKTEIEEKIRKILNLIKEEEGEKDGNTIGNAKKEPLVELIEDFHKHYQNLYARYDHLTGELREKVHGKQEKENSSSSSSGSDTDYSLREMGSKNGKVETEFQKATDVIKQELDTAHLEVADLKRKLADTIEEKQALHLEYQTALNKIQEAEKIISGLQIEGETLKGEKSKLSLEIKDLNLRLDGASNLAAEMNQKLDDIRRERSDLLMEKETALQRAEEGEKIIEEFKVMSTQLNNEKKMLQLELEGVKGILSTVKEELESSEQEVANLIQTQKATEEQSNSLSSKNLELLNEISEAQDKIQVLMAESSQFREKLDGRERDLASHIEMHETHKSEASTRMSGLELELDSLHTQKREMEKQKDEELSVLMKKLEDKEKDSLSQIEDLTTQVNNLQVEVKSLLAERSRLEEEMAHERTASSGQLKDLSEKINEKQQEVESLNSQIFEFECQLEKKIQELSEYLVQIRTLEEESRNKNADQQKMLEEREGFMLQVEGLKQEVESLRSQKSELEEQLRGKDHETDQMLAEKESLQDCIFELEKTLTESANELSTLQEKSRDREDEASAQIANLTAQVNNLQLEVDSLHAQKAESESHLEKKALEIAQYLDHIENLKEDSASKAIDGQKMLEERESLKVQVKNLEIEVDALLNQKSKLEEQIENQSQGIDHLRTEKEGLDERISELEKTLMEKGEELFDLQKKLEDAGNESTTQIMALTMQVNILQQELDFIHSEKSKLELQIEQGKQESSEILTQVENQNAELENKVADLQRMLKEQEDAYNKLSEEHKQLELLFQECKANLKVAERKIEETDEELQKSIESKDREVDELEEQVEELKRDLEMKGDEVSTLTENVRNIEVKLRLSNQKLRVTEQVLTEKEESHKNKEEKLQREQKLLEERIAMLSGAVAAYKEAQVKIIADISVKVKNTMIGLDTLTLKFEEDYGHFETRVYEILNEIQVLKSWVKETNCEKAKLKEEVGSLVQLLQDKKEQESVLREQVGELEPKLLQVEEEKQSLMKALKRLEERTGELEKMLHVKDDGILGIGEEKREAIRQLCIWIDYHRDRCDFLKEMLSKRSGRRPIAT